MSDKLPLMHSPLEDHPEYTKALGMIGIEIGVLEIALGEMLGAILGINTDLSQIIYMTPQSYIGRLQILENVIEAVMKPDASGTKALLGYISQTKARIQYRNDAMHSVWGVKTSDKSVVTRRPVPLVDKKPQIPVPITELQDQISKLRKLSAEVYAEVKIVIEQRAALEAQLQKERKQGLHAKKIKGGP